MKFIWLGLLAGVSAQAGNVNVWECSSQCVAVDLDANRVMFLGEAVGTASLKLGKKSRRVAWKNARARCSELASEAGFSSSLLVKGWIEIETRESGRRFYDAERDLSLSFDFATPGSSCVKEMMTEGEVVPVYEGDLPVLG